MVGQGEQSRSASALSPWTRTVAGTAVEHVTAVSIGGGQEQGVPIRAKNLTSGEADRQKGRAEAMEPKLKPGRKFIDAGPAACSDAEILAILIGSGGPGYSALHCANSVLEKFGTLPGIMGKPVRDLTQIRGINTVKAIKIAAAFELACRIVDHLGRDG